MMRTVEVLLVVILLGAAYVAASSYITLPSPSSVSPVDLNKLAYTTLQELDSRFDLSSAAFQTSNITEWNNLQVALSASLPPNMVYNLTIYNVNTASNGAPLYTNAASFSNAANLPSSDASTYLVASSNVTYTSTPQQISTNGVPITLYILNCSDTNGWWITGYTPSSLAQTVYSLLSPYFKNTVMVQNTNQLNQLLNGQSLQGEAVNNSVIINTCGEAVPIPTNFSNSGVNSTQGYDSSHTSYAMYDYTLGKITQLYNWTWVSIVGWPFYYATNTGFLSTTQNSWGIYGMNIVATQGLSAFLEGLDNQPYVYTASTTGTPGVVYLSSQTQSLCNYYGLYPSTYQTSTRALPTSITTQYNLTVTTYLFNTTFGGGQYNPGALYRHHWTTNINGVNVTNYQGGFLALGMTRIPDIRLTALGILCDYQPTRYSSLYTASGSNRLVVLQLGTVGGG
ncbi:MAG: hypothetical protein ABSA75_04980 [Candidatus Bathyarchaeia archaeon]|jgi:hypothetical protein